jgi:hypothetical protein
MTRISLKHLALVALAATGACARGEARPAQDAPAPRVVTVTAADFAYQAPASIPAGVTTIRLVNNGPELHHVQLVRLDSGHTLPEFMDAMKAGGPPPAWAHWVGGPNTPAPDGHSVTETTLDLTAGEYVLLCVIPSADGQLHAMKGMFKPLTVTAAPAGPAAAAPAVDARMTLSDYSYGLAGEVAAGRRTIRVENGAAQPHEVVLVQLAPGKTAQDMMGWIMNMQGPPPGRPIGGTSMLGRGAVNFVTADFAAGDYALLCMVPDAGDGKPHVMHGMVQQFTVR